MKKLLPLLFTLTTLFAFGQSESDYKTVMYTHELEELINKNEPLRIEDTYFKLDRRVEYVNGNPTVVGKDKKYYKLHFTEEGEYKGSEPIYLNLKNSNNILFKNCCFEYLYFDNSQFDNLTFFGCTFNSTYTEIVNSGLVKLIFAHCTFYNDLVLDDLNIETTLSISSCNKQSNFSESSSVFITDTEAYETDIMSSNFNSLGFNRNQIHEGVTFTLNSVKNNLMIKNNTFNVDSLWLLKSFGWGVNKTYRFDKNYQRQYFVVANSVLNEVEFSDNIFSYPTDTGVVQNIYNYNFISCDIDELIFKNENMFRLSFNNSNINQNLSIDSSLIFRDFSAINLSLPEYNIDFPWRELAGKLNFLINDSTNYRAITNEELADEKLYSSFITTYKKFFSVYKNKGDLKSANACYAEMKDVETRRLKYLYETEGGVDNLLNYQLNVFLKYFAEYGTSPIKSVKISGWVILIFAFFYFFFYSDWDQINRKFLMDRGEKLMSYFKSEQKLEELYSDKHKEDLTTFTQFKQNLKESKTQVPFFFMLFLKPLYWVAVIKHKGNKALYKRVEFLQGKWVDLSTGKKFFLGTLTFFTILTYGLYLVTIRSLNSLILSINTFTTLGFGDIPVVGISRYVAILEGFLGWFLLSIFSVSLISQILQN